MGYHHRRNCGADLCCHLRCHLAGGEKRVPLLVARWRLNVWRGRSGSNLAARCGDLGDRFGDVRRGLATLLRIQALATQGDRAGATRVGERFLAMHPSSPYASEVRRLTGGNEP
jgi:hypothetical protein